MPPMIRVDDEVYEYLNQQGRTEDSFNDVIRRELGLELRKPAAAKPLASMDHEVKQAMDTNKLKAVEDALNRLLPPHWANAPKRRNQIFEVVSAFLHTPKEWGTAEREVHAAKLVAERRGIDVNTVQDKCGRQLYGEGSLMQQFRNALERLELRLGQQE